MRRTAVLALVVSLASAGSGCRDTEPPSQVTVEDAFTAEASTALAVYLHVANAGGSDAIVGARVVGTPGAVDRVTLHRRAERDGLTIMEPADAIEIGADSDDALVPAGGHVMLEGLAEPVVAGDAVELVIDMDRSDDVTVTVPVVTADEAVALTAAD